MPDNTVTAPATAGIDETAAATQLRQLTIDVKTLILATGRNDDAPEASYAPCVFDDEGRVYVYVSALARHTVNLRKAATVSVMLIEDEASAESLYARKRITWSCQVDSIARETAAFSERMEAFRDRFGSIMDTLADMQDFQLFRLTPGDGRLVLGFGAAFNVDGFTVKRQMHGKHRPAKG